MHFATWRSLLFIGVKFVGFCRFKAAHKVLSSSSYSRHILNGKVNSFSRGLRKLEAKNYVFITIA